MYIRGTVSGVPPLALVSMYASLYEWQYLRVSLVLLVTLPSLLSYAKPFVFGKLCGLPIYTSMCVAEPPLPKGVYPTLTCPCSNISS